MKIQDFHQTNTYELTNLCVDTFKTHAISELLYGSNILPLVLKTDSEATVETGIARKDHCVWELSIYVLSACNAFNAGRGLGSASGTGTTGKACRINNYLKEDLQRQKRSESIADRVGAKTVTDSENQVSSVIICYSNVSEVVPQADAGAGLLRAINAPQTEGVLLDSRARPSLPFANGNFLPRRPPVSSRRGFGLGPSSLHPLRGKEARNGSDETLEDGPVVHLLLTRRPYGYPESL
ncbi:hypothetical protein LXL04_014426 [Taraxacum kok-saghyz]